MVDRRESAHQRQRERELPRIAGERDQQHRHTHAEEKYEHHLATTPVVAEFAGRQRPQAEHDERTGAVRHEIFPPRQVEVGGNRADRRREDEQEHVIERMRDVQQQRGRSRFRKFHRGILPRQRLKLGGERVGNCYTCDSALGRELEATCARHPHSRILHHFCDQRFDASKISVASGHRAGIDH